MNKLKLILISFISGTILALILTKLYWPTKGIEIIDRAVSPTIWTYTEYIEKKPELNQKDFNLFYNCYISEMNVETNIEDSTLYGKAYDSCKSVDFKVRLRAKSTLKHIIQASYIFQYEIGSAYELAYLYNFSDIISIGGGIIISKTNPAVKVTVQKAFNF